MRRREFIGKSIQALAASTLAGALRANASEPSGKKPKPATPKPNVLWIMTDEQRTDSLGCYGSAWARTPNLDRLAREGAIFQHAITPAPVCAPARASIMTGRYPHENGIWWNIAPKDYPTLPHLTEIFHRAGYHSASIGKRHYSTRNNAFQYESSFEVSDAVDWYHFAPPLNPKDFDTVAYPDAAHPWILGGRFPVSEDRTSESRVVREARAWLDARDPSEPFLLRLSFNAPHTPVVPPAPFDTIVAPDTIRLPQETEAAPDGEPDWVTHSLRSAEDASRLTPEQLAKMRAYYYGEAAYLDHKIGEMLEWMRGRGLLDNTIVVFVSDHGTHVGDYRLVQKQSFYEPVVNVPFFFWYPQRVKAGIQFTTPVETRSLLPTLLGLADLSAPHFCRRIDLSHSLCRGLEPTSRPVFSEFTLGTLGLRPNDRLVMVRDGDWKLSVCVAGEMKDAALYNLRTDPYERVNLCGRADAERERRRLTRQIASHMHARR